MEPPAVGSGEAMSSLNTRDGKLAKGALPLSEACGVDCCRGELRLSDEEYGAVSKMLADLQNAATGFWRLEYIADPPRKTNKKSGSGSLTGREAEESATRSTRSTTGSTRRKSTSSQLSNQSHLTGGKSKSKGRISRSSTSAGGCGGSDFVVPQSPLSTTGEAEKTEGVSEKRPSPWVEGPVSGEEASFGGGWRELCRKLITQLSQKPPAVPFLNSPFSDSSPDNPSAINKSTPPPPVCLSKILRGLERGEYESGSEVLSEVYTVWVGAFRWSLPGSYLWNKAQEASQLFCGMVDREPSLSEKLPPLSDSTKPKQSHKLKPSISDQQRVHFQELLSALSQDQHFMLFYRFQYTAVWKSLDDGVVELDDRATSPAVFREMETWCQAQLGEEPGGNENSNNNVTNNKNSNNNNNTNNNINNNIRGNNNNNSNGRSNNSSNVNGKMENGVQEASSGKKMYNGKAFDNSRDGNDMNNNMSNNIGNNNSSNANNSGDNLSEKNEENVKRPNLSNNGDESRVENGLTLPYLGSDYGSPHNNRSVNTCGSISDTTTSHNTSDNSGCNVGDALNNIADDNRTEGHGGLHSPHSNAAHQNSNSRVAPNSQIKFETHNDEPRSHSSSDNNSSVPPNTPSPNDPSKPHKDTYGEQNEKINSLEPDDRILKKQKMSQPSH